MGNEGAGPVSSKTSANKACLGCRKVKMKCRVGGTEPRCERCIRKSLQCVFQEHQRGRKPGTRISTSNVERLATERSAPRTEHSTGTGCSAPELQRADEYRDWQTGNLQPPGILNHAATHGRFSLQSILETAPSVPPQHMPSETAIAPDDPIKLGLVNMHIANSLFENFMNSLNLYISQMDPGLHTFGYVRQKCPFLFTAMLAAAAKALHPELYPKLHDHVEELFGRNFRLGRKSTEIAQAVLIMTYWKEPDDSRAWVSLGYVIRMGMELGWHRLKPYAAAQEGHSSDAQKREVRNIQRLWFILFVYDRSMSLQTGKPWMIERNAFIESIEPWCEDSMGIASDYLLGALVTLRLLSSEVFKLLGPKSSKVGDDQLHGLESLLSIIKVRVEEWECKWLRSVAAGPIESCHSFLIRFYGTHLRLQLFSLPLQEILASKEPDVSSHLEVLWVSFSNAMKMLQLIRNSANWLYFAQDSIHVMTAYSAAFLIRLLLSTPGDIASRIEPQVCDTIRSAADAFSRQSSPPGSSCWLQARFLERIVTKNAEKRHPRDLVHSYMVPTSDPAASSSANSVLAGEGSSSANDATASRGPSTINPQEDDPIREHRHSNEPPLDFAFSADEWVWTDVFTGAGFSIQEGIFFA